MIVLLVAAGALIGAPARYLTDRAVQARRASAFPWGTFVVNAVASFVLGVVAGASASPEIAALVATGFCGALSTFSTFSYEALALTQQCRLRRAAGYVALSVTVALGAVSLGWLLGAAL